MKKLLLLPVLLLFIKDPCFAQNCQASFTWSQGGPNQIIFTSTSTGTNSGTMYYWSFGDSQTSWTQNPAHTYANPGMYMVCLTIFDSMQCQSSFCDTIQVTGQQGCQANFTFSVNGNTVTFTNTSNGGSWYSWTFGDNGTSTQTSPTHVYTNSGTYMVCLIIQDSSCVDSICQYVTIGSSGWNDGPENVKGVSLYPNPSSGNSSLEILTGAPADLTIELLDITGNKIETIAGGKFSEGQHTFRISTGNIPAGIYLVKISDTKASLTKRLTVIH
ncbi:MAG: PKD domain-containing protein [Bacteroidia bacterium]|nr:PKD domain-containing protein [Bacteroidia bacterium]